MDNQELNDWIAENVMEYKLIKQKVRINDTFDESPYKGNWRWWHEERGEGWEYIKYKPTENIEAAWQVVNRMKAMNFFPCISQGDENEWFCEFTHKEIIDSYGQPKYYGEAEANTAELVICLSAKEAIQRKIYKESKEDTNEKK